MCGICGIIDFGHTLSHQEREGQVNKMNTALEHRGPDDSGSFSDQYCTLAMRRLAIIDQDSGKQPIFNASGNRCIVFNGEIYNYRELKKILVSKGHHFRTNSDTEVLLELYEDLGVNMLDMIKGMFSFCIYDLKEQTCFLARDPFGEKPLYYHWNNRVFSFSSEIKSLLENNTIERKLNHTALPYYFRTSLVPEPITLLDNVKSLLPGHYLKVNTRGIEEQVYFKPKYESAPSIQSVDEAVTLVRPFLESAVKRQTVSDVPIGAFLSGGIDSSTVVALLQQNSSKPIQTFNVRFENQAYDESAVARKVANFCGTDHQEVFVPDVDFDESIFWKIIDHVGLPFRDSSAIPSFLISQEIAKHVKVALSGDGGDELFGGYSLFQWYKKIVDFKKVARPVRSAMNQSLGLAQQIPLLNQWSTIRKLKRGVHTSLLDLQEIPIALNELFNEKQMKDLLNGRSHSAYSLLQTYPSNFEDWSSLRKIMYYRLVHTLPANMLVKVDRMSMANSLEVRAPFLDPELFAVSAKLSDDLLVREGKGKFILRKIMEKDLPPEVFNHPKMGFSIPLYRYQNEAYKKLAQRLLFEENPWPDLIPKDQLKVIYNRGIYTQRDTAKRTVFQTAHQLWMLMQLFGWAKRFNVQM